MLNNKPLKKYIHFSGEWALAKSRNTLLAHKCTNNFEDYKITVFDKEINQYYCVGCRKYAPEDIVRKARFLDKMLGM